MQFISYEHIYAILTPIVSGLFLTFVFWLFKIPKAIESNTTATNKLTAAVESLTKDFDVLDGKVIEGEKRHDITQKILSDILEEPIDTKSISINFSHYPKFSSYKKRKEN